MDTETGATPPSGGDAPRRRGLSRLRIALSLCLTLLFLLLLLRYVSNHLDEFKELLRRPLSRSRLSLLALALFSVYLVNAEIFRKALRAHRVFLPFAENLSLSYATTALNYFLPFKGAVGLRALYLSRRHSLSLTDFLSQLFVISFTTLTVSSLLALPGLALLSGGRDGGRAAFVCALYFALVPALCLASLFSGKLQNLAPAKIKVFLSSWDRYRRNPALLGELVFWNLLYYLAWCLANHLALGAFQVRLGPLEVFFYTSLQIHGLIINLTPAGLGVVEAAGVFAGSILDFSPAEALLAQGLSRLTAVAVLGLAGIVSWFHLLALKKAGGGSGKEAGGGVKEETDKSGKKTEGNGAEKAPRG
ncbi:MAG: flippase-like domain-containing protein [Deltaproteobacteria bacterium]|nr:flippase-like domain-containing protein [Deltaproteobacteria bacterium]